jgi:TetR/AcrR family transcriptional repressor of nem operon
MLPVMARPREFDPDAALERAMQVFWTKGYEATSLDDLCEATGLGRSSLYAAFGDKHALLLRSLDRYEEISAARIAAALARPLPIRESIAALLGEFIEKIAAGPGRRGCFIGNCAAELARHDREALGRVRRSLERTEAQFRTALDRARSRGELPPRANPTALARFFASGIHGLRLVGKTNPDRAVLNDIAAVMLRCFDA